MASERTAGPILPAHIEETVRAIADLHAEHHRRATPIQRVVERSVRLVGKPTFIALLTLFVIGWIFLNLILSRFNSAFDGPPFQALQDVGELLGLYITVLILITQRRENELLGHREQLTLELAILSEQKNAKIIQLLEEIRRDSPHLADRHDPEAAALSVAADPQAVFDAIRDRHEEMVAKVEATGVAVPSKGDQ